MKGIRWYLSIENMILFHNHTPYWRFRPSHDLILSSDFKIFSAICCDILNILMITNRVCRE